MDLTASDEKVCEAQFVSVSDQCTMENFDPCNSAETALFEASKVEGTNDGVAIEAESVAIAPPQEMEVDEESTGNMVAQTAETKEDEAHSLPTDDGSVTAIEAEIVPTAPPQGMEFDEESESVTVNAVAQTAEANEEEAVSLPIDPTPLPEPPVAERRLSARLSSAHIRKAELAISKKPKGSSLPVRSSNLAGKVYSRSSLPKRSVDKENSKPALFNKSLNHIPTLQERVAAMTAAKRQPPAKVVEVSGKRPKFDLNASLKRPLGYKPHSGPLEKKS